MQTAVLGRLAVAQCQSVWSDWVGRWPLRTAPHYIHRVNRLNFPTGIRHDVVVVVVAAFFIMIIFIHQHKR